MRDPINPADIRVGDRVERVTEQRGVETIIRCVITRLEGGIIFAGGLGWGVLAGGQWYLLDRPDPDAPLIERVAEAICNDDHSQETSFGWAVVGVDTKDAYRDNARAALAAIRETHDIVPKGGE